MIHTDVTSTSLVNGASPLATMLFSAHLSELPMDATDKTLNTGLEKFRNTGACLALSIETVNEKNEYRPIDLLNKTRDKFQCLHCCSELVFIRGSTKLKSSRLATANCSQCKKSITFKLPEIKRKRIYLDQSILSELYKFERSTIETLQGESWQKRLTIKIRVAKQLQKAYFVVSDLHAQETAAMPDDYREEQQQLWAYALSLSDGIISGNQVDAFLYDLERIVGHQLSSNIKSKNNCYSTTVIDTFAIGGQMISSNRRALNEHQNWIQYRRQHLITEFTDILNKQQIATGGEPSLANCIATVQSLYLKDLIAGLKVARDLSIALEKSSGWTDEAGFWEGIRQQSVHFDNDNWYCRAAMDSTGGYPSKKQQIDFLTAAVNQAEHHGLNEFPSVRLLATLEGDVLHRWMLDAKHNPKKFNGKYGASRSMDNMHLATYFPVVDAITVDQDTFNRCKLPAVASELSKYDGQIFTGNEETHDLEPWLDALIAEPETDEVRYARRLLVGLSDAEYSEEVLEPLIHDALATLIAKNSTRTQA